MRSGSKGATVPLVRRIVVDRTGLRGAYDFALNYTPALPPALNGAPLPPLPASANGDGASIFTALREQLGLALESRRAPHRAGGNRKSGAPGRD